MCKDITKALKNMQTKLVNGDKGEEVKGGKRRG